MPEDDPNIISYDIFLLRGAAKDIYLAREHLEQAAASARCINLSELTPRMRTKVFKAYQDLKHDIAMTSDTMKSAMARREQQIGRPLTPEELHSLLKETDPEAFVIRMI